MSGSIKLTKTREIALIGVMSALCVASRVGLQFLPNIKPVTSFIIIMSGMFGVWFGVKLAIISTLASNIILGMGPWTIFQILAWVMIAVLAAMLSKTVFWKNKVVMSCVAFFSGYLYGIIVSLEKILYGGFYSYIGYYLAGLSFDTLHAIGNFVFYPICLMIINRSLKVS